MSPNNLPQYKLDFLQAAINGNILKFGSFELKSGRISPYFFNAGDFYRADLLRAISTALVLHFLPNPPKAQSTPFPLTPFISNSLIPPLQVRKSHNRSSILTLSLFSHFQQPYPRIRHSLRARIQRHPTRFLNSRQTGGFRREEVWADLLFF